MSKKLVSSSLYPTLLSVGVTVVLTYLITFVVPKFGELYEQLDTQLPAITVFMLNIGTIAQKYFWIIGSAVALLILFVMRWRKTQSGSERIDRLRLKLPFLAAFCLKYH